MADTKPDGARKKILVIDDSRIMVSLVRQALEQLDKYDIVEASDGVQGLRQYYSEQPDCVIVDVVMPNLDGFQFTRAVRGDHQMAQPALVILTTQSRDDNRLTGLLSGADEYVLKPFKAAELCAIVERALALSPEQRAQRWLELAGEAPQPSS